MRAKHYLLSVTNAVTGLLFLLSGALLALLPWSRGLRATLVGLIEERGDLLALAGLALASVGYLLLSNLLRHRVRYHYIRTGSRSVAISDSVIDDTIERYLVGLFPEREFDFATEIKGGRLLITADLPPAAFDEQRALVERMERDLDSLLLGTLGYEQPFSLAAGFRPARLAVVE